MVVPEEESAVMVHAVHLSVLSPTPSGEILFADKGRGTCELSYKVCFGKVKHGFYLPWLFAEDTTYGNGLKVSSASPSAPVPGHTSVLLCTHSLHTCTFLPSESPSQIVQLDGLL